MKVSSLTQDKHDRLAGRVTHVPRVICHAGPETRYLSGLGTCVTHRYQDLRDTPL